MPLNKENIPNHSTLLIYLSIYLILFISVSQYINTSTLLIYLSIYAILSLSISLYIMSQVKTWSIDGKIDRYKISSWIENIYSHFKYLFW